MVLGQQAAISIPGNEDPYFATGLLVKRVNLKPTFRTPTFTTCIGHEDSTV